MEVPRQAGRENRSISRDLLHPVAVLGGTARALVSARAGGRGQGRKEGPRTRAARFTSDERMLDSTSFSGDVSLSKSLLDALGKIKVAEASADNYHVFTKLGDGSVLVLIESPNLQNFKMPARVELLHAIELILASQPQTKGRQPFIGVKGRIAFGAIRVPPDQIKTGSVLAETPLYDFYGRLVEPAASSP